MDSIATRVARGAAHLDKHKPDWWHADNLDLDTLDQQRNTLCVLGQNYGAYWTSLDKIGLDGEGAISMGFNMDYSEGGDYRNHMLYTSEWRRVVEQRRRGLLVERLGGSTGTSLHFEAEPAPLTAEEEALLLDIARKGIVDLYLAASGRPESDRVLVQALLG